MTDELSELKRLAEKALSALTYEQAYSWDIDYQNAASPSAILSLIARLEAAEAALDDAQTVARE